MKFISGFAAILGSPNVGKSTLMNAMIGQKISIVTHKAQTTRNRVVGILTRGDRQIVFLDTPGLQTPKNRLGDYMARVSNDSAQDVDAILMVIDAEVGIKERDTEYLALLASPQLLVVINKTDLVTREQLDALHKKIVALGTGEDHIVEVCALNGRGLHDLEDRIVALLPEGPMYYPEDMVTDRPERFIAGELVREKVLLNLREEIPHGVGIEIERVEERDGLTDVDALIVCERDSHKGIIIGKKGAMLKKIGTEARAELEMLFGTKVFLQLWVKVKKDWRNSAFMLKELGYRQD